MFREIFDMIYPFLLLFHSIYSPSIHPLSIPPLVNQSVSWACMKEGKSICSGWQGLGWLVGGYSDHKWDNPPASLEQLGSLSSSSMQSMMERIEDSSVWVKYVLAVPNHIILYYIILYYIILYYIVLYYIILYYIVLYCIILYCIILYYIILYYIVLYYIIFYYIVLYFIIFYYVICLLLKVLQVIHHIVYIIYYTLRRPYCETSGESFVR